ncbi:stage II sporulation protein D [Clostridium sp.]|uniref:stage II sporulation protein D n=1 Tax=Clostridium sp. TaxID=1506 RepID=UPI002616CCE9|nr:stage II sporulation protein D [Clostridium sp.]
MKNKININEGLISLSFFSVLILILIVVVPLSVMRNYTVDAKENNIDLEEKENIKSEEKAKESSYIELDFNETIKVYMTKEDKIVEIPMESYVKSVVSGEMPVSFDIEALKAQAIAARTFVSSRKLTPCSQGKGADVCDSTHCQVYIQKEERMEAWKDEAIEYWDKIESAVNSTKGIVLTYENELVKYPQFFSTSSGKTENSIDVFSGDIPYLVSTESPGEEIAPKYAKDFPFTLDEFIEKINSKYASANLTKENINANIEIISRSDAGGIKEIRIGEEKVKGLEFRLYLGLTSTNFQYSIADNNIIFKCKGYGHGVGMSQWGANVMAKDNKGFEEILKHYYTGIELKEIKYKN